jgi:hypothetical protein
MLYIPAPLPRPVPSLVVTSHPSPRVHVPIAIVVQLLSKRDIETIRFKRADAFFTKQVRRALFTASI